MATPDILQGQNGIILDSARMSMHGLSTPGATFSVPLQENPASQSPNPWVSSDLADREIGINVGDGSAYYRWGQTISQFGGGTATGPQGPIGSTGPQGPTGPGSMAAGITGSVQLNDGSGNFTYSINFTYDYEDDTFISGPSNQIIDSTDSAILNGLNNTINSDLGESTIVGGSNNEISNGYGVIVSGGSNTSDNNNGGYIFGSFNSIIASSSISSIIGSFNSDIIESTQSVIIGGENMNLTHAQNMVMVPKLTITEPVGTGSFFATLDINGVIGSFSANFLTFSMIVSAVGTTGSIQLNSGTGSFTASSMFSYDTTTNNLIIGSGSGAGLSNSIITYNNIILQGTASIISGSASFSKAIGTIGDIQYTDGKGNFTASVNNAGGSNLNYDYINNNLKLVANGTIADNTIVTSIDSAIIGGNIGNNITSGKGSNIFGGNENIIDIDNGISSIVGGISNTITTGSASGIIAGNNNSVSNDGGNSVVIGGSGNGITNGHNNMIISSQGSNIVSSTGSVILGGNSITLSNFNNTVAVPSLLITDPVGTGSNILTIDTNGNVGIESHSYFTPSTGGTVNLVSGSYNIINPATSILTLTVNVPGSPNDNDFVEIKYTQAVTTVTYGNGTVKDGIISPVLGQGFKLVYHAATTTWY